jgi:hypothetical protein
MAEIINFSSTSSGPNGWSNLSKFLECPSKAAVGRAESIERGDIPYELFPEDKGKPVNTTVGSLYGELMQMWMRGTPPSPRAEFHWNGVSIQKSHPATVAETWRLYDEAVKHYGSIEQMNIGELVATEMPIEIPESILGIKVTGNIDVVTRTAEGVWIRDIKTHGKEEQSLRDYWSLRQQLWIYAWGYELATGEKPVGVGIDCCIKTAEPKFRRFDFEALTERRLKWLVESIERVKTAMANPRPAPCISNCWAYNKPCTFLIENQCSLL